MNNKVIPIVFSANSIYAPYISVVITSIIKNARANRRYVFNVLYTELPDNIILRIENLCGENYNTKCINVKKFCREGMYSSGYFSIEMYYRIMIPEIFVEYDKVLYLDCDMVVLHDISELFDVDISNYLIGGVRNLMHEKMKKYIQFSLDVDADKYINSGVILFNCTKCRQEKYTEKSFKLLIKRQDFRYPDQDLINIICSGRICYLNPKWNFTWHYRHLQESLNCELHLNDEDLKKFLEYEKEPYLIHYTGEIKPWNNVNKYLSDYFWDYAKDSIFFNLFLVRLIKNNKICANGIEYEKRLTALEAALFNLENDNKEKKDAASTNQEEKYLEMYNTVIGSKSYKLGRLLTFPIRKIIDISISVKNIGFKRTFKLFPKKLALYKCIITGKQETEHTS